LLTSVNNNEVTSSLAIPFTRKIHRVLLSHKTEQNSDSDDCVCSTQPDTTRLHISTAKTNTQDLAQVVWDVAWNGSIAELVGPSASLKRMTLKPQR